MRCGDAVRQAVQCDPASHEAWQTMASYCISAQRVEEGKEALLKSVSLWINAQQDGKLSVLQDCLASALKLPVARQGRTGRKTQPQESCPHTNSESTLSGY